MCPVLVFVRLEPPAFEVIIEKSSLKQELENNLDDLDKGVGRVYVRGIVHRIFDLIDENFKS